MKKFLALLLALTMALSLVTTGAWAADSIQVTVTIANQGAIAVGKNDTLMAQVPVTVTDLNKDGKFTYDEAMTAAHKAYYEKGEAGFAMDGSMCSMLWGVETKNLCFYRNNEQTGFINEQSITANDNLVAFPYMDTTGFSDRYGFFNQETVSAKTDEAVTLNLQGQGYNESFVMTTEPVVGAELEVYQNGKFQKLNVVTDDKGNSTISFDKAGKYVVSAQKSGIKWVPPVCIVTVTDQTPAADLTKEATNALATCVNGYQTAKKDVTCQFGAEWVMLGRLRALDGAQGWKTKDADIQTYAGSVMTAIQSGKLSKETVPTTIERVVLTLTALVLITSGLIPEGMTGTALTQAAFSLTFGSFGKVFIAICMLFFAFSTILGWYFFGQVNFNALFGSKYTKVYSLIVVLFILIGSSLKVDLVWALADFFNGLMAVPNLLALLALSGVVAGIARNKKD